MSAFWADPVAPQRTDAVRPLKTKLDQGRTLRLISRLTDRRFPRSLFHGRTNWVRDESRAAAFQAVLPAGRDGGGSPARADFPGLDCQADRPFEADHLRDHGVGRLEDAGWVVETGRTAGHVGRSAVIYEVVPDAACRGCRPRRHEGSHRPLGPSRCHRRRGGELTRPAGGQAVIDQIARLCRETAASAGVGRGRIASRWQVCQERPSR